MQISEAQVAVADHHNTDEVIFLAALGRLVDALMFSTGDNEWCGKFPPFTDGVLFEYEESRSDHFVGHGLALILGQGEYVEPISVEIWFDSISKEMTRATMMFGKLDSTKTDFSSRAASKISQYVVIKALSGKPKVDFDWKYKFSLIDGTWSNEHLS